MAEGEIQSHEQCVQVNLAVVPECGEDSFAFHRDMRSGFLCVADGCGGLGAKRYERMEGRTGAYLAARLATDCVSRWAKEGLIGFPQTRLEGLALCAALSGRLAGEMKRYEAAHTSEGGIRITGSMRRALPTTLCAAIFKHVPETMLDCLFLWAGDSRGYLLDTGGLHQLTADHTAKTKDAMESLYNDAPLQNMINADTPFVVNARRIRTPCPCVVITATDGAFAYLPTPMEFEWALLSTLKASASMAAWQKKLAGKLKKVASDDCTVLAAMAGYDDFEALKASMEQRHAQLQEIYITPVRRRKMRLTYAREKWEQYRTEYDWTEGKAYGELDWRV